MPKLIIDENSVSCTFLYLDSSFLLSDHNKQYILYVVTFYLYTVVRIPNKFGKTINRMWREITCLKFQDKICSSYWFVENRDFGIDSRKFYVEGKWESMGWEGHVSDVQNNYTYENCTISKDYKNIFVLRSGHRYISVFFIFFFNFRIKIKSISFKVESFSKQKFFDQSERRLFAFRLVGNSGIWFVE